MQGDQQPHTATESSANPLLDRLLDYEKRSLEHEVGEASRQQVSNWDGVVFRLGDYYLTCRIDQVEEIIAFPAYTPIPGAKEWLLGIANVRGNLAPVSDLGWYLFGSRTPVTARTRLVMSRIQNRLAGLVVDEVFGQRHFHTDDLSEQAEWKDTPLAELVTHQFETSERIWGVLDLDKLRQDPEFMDGARRE